MEGILQRTTTEVKNFDNQYRLHLTSLKSALQKTTKNMQLFKTDVLALRNMTEHFKAVVLKQISQLMKNANLHFKTIQTLKKQLSTLEVELRQFLQAAEQPASSKKAVGAVPSPPAHCLIKSLETAFKILIMKMLQQQAGLLYFLDKNDIESITVTIYEDKFRNEIDVLLTKLYTAAVALRQEKPNIMTIIHHKKKILKQYEDDELILSQALNMTDRMELINQDNEQLTLSEAEEQLGDAEKTMDDAPSTSDDSE